MSKYTITIRNLLDNDYKIFDFDYPIFDPKYKGVLEKKIIDRYYFREIGFETPAQFKHYLKMRLNEIMPYYNQLYKSESIMNKEGFNPLHNLDTTETHKRKQKQALVGKEKRGNTVTQSSNGKETFEDTPQSALGNSNYVTSITRAEGSTNTYDNIDASSSSDVDTMEEYETRVLGSGGLRYPADIIIEWRKSFLNIDTDILDNLNDLFMGVY